MAGRTPLPIGGLGKVAYTAVDGAVQARARTRDAGGNVRRLFATATDEQSALQRLETQAKVLTWGSVPPAMDRPLEVSVPSDGRPLLIDVQSGCPTMTVQKGKAVIRVGGNGFGITVAAGAHAVVIGQPGHKVSITAEAGSTVDFYTEPDSRGYQSIADGANFRMHGRADNVTLSSDAR